MPINNQTKYDEGPGIRVETNVNGNIVDNDQWVQDKAHLEHTQVPNEPWAQGFEQAQAEQEEMQRKIRELYEEFTGVTPDPSLIEANLNDLKLRNLDK